MKPKRFNIALACALLLAAVVTGCQKKQDAVPANPGTDSSTPGNGAAPGAAHVDPSKSPTADPASPLYGWEKFSSTAGKFSAFFPSRPKETDQTQQGKDGEIQAHAFASGTDPANAYMVSYYDVPHAVDPKLLLAKVEESMLKRENGKIVSYQAMQIGNNPATEFEFVFGTRPGYSGHVRLISVGQRVYVLMTIFLTAQPHPDARDAFFNSFTLQN